MKTRITTIISISALKVILAFQRNKCNLEIETMKRGRCRRGVAGSVRIVGLFCLILGLAQVQAATKILVLGGTVPFPIRGMSEEAFPPSEVASSLTSILEGDVAISKPVTVQSVDTYKIEEGVNTNIADKARSLMSWFYWPYTHTNTLALLQGGWDYVLMIDNPLVASMFPAYHFEGVQAISAEARKGGSQPVLVMPWSSGSTALSKFGEMAYRVADGVGIPVAAAGYAWNNVSDNLKDSGIRPTPRGAYVTAATVYSRLFNRSAKLSTYVPAGLSTEDRDLLADTAFSTVQAEATNSHYNGLYVGPTHFVTPANKKRYLECADQNSSTESGISRGWGDSLAQSRVKWYRYTSTYQTLPVIDHVIDFCQNRYQITSDADLSKWKSYASFDYQVDGGSNTMISGVDEVMYQTPTNYIDKEEYSVPVRIMWSRIRTAHPEIPCQPDGHHMSSQFCNGIGSMMYTLLSGRCPIGVEPSNKASGTWQSWYCRKIGYEIAWQLASLNSRVPGFEVLPGSASSTNLTILANEPMTVRFLYAPTSTVTVAISADNANAVIVTPSMLTFTEANYSTPQTVLIKVNTNVVEGPVNINLASSSSDGVFNGLKDQWAYNVTTNQVPVANEQSVTAVVDTAKAIKLTGSDAEGHQLTYTIVNQPFHGTLSGVVPNVVYTPNSGYSGKDEFTFKVNDGSLDSEVATISITMNPSEILIGEDNFDTAGVYLSKTNSDPKNQSTVVWNTVNRDTVAGPNIIDTSVQPGGVVATNSTDTDGFLESSKTDRFFGIYRGGLTAPRTLTYQFDIAGFQNLLLSMDWAASGDVPDPIITVSNSIDGVVSASSMVIGTFTSGWVETMEDGRSVTNNRRATVTISGIDALPLTDVFKNYQMEISGTGSVLTLTLRMGSSVSGPAYGLDNVKLYGTPTAIGYYGWIDTCGLSVSNSLPTGDPDGDGRNNFAEYAFGGNPANPDPGHVPTGALRSIDQTNFFEYVYARRRTPHNGLVYTVESCSNLLSKDWATARITGLPVVEPINEEFEAVAVRIPMVEGAAFIRSRVESAP
jgi:hypothetical protein